MENTKKVTEAKNVEKDEFKKAMLDCCERNVDVISPKLITFLYDLVNTAITASKIVWLQALLPIINASKAPLETFIAKLVDKINGVADKTEAVA